ncbi:MAG: 16S rRNA processing protein RimM [Bacteroidetes bacterium HGW-Bacteroidetes-1]|jgi:16S rRNA processing protein RimM|nr:MAG: 16S rRNA processing protein RimM [Bacteroidetes bacterium HGW-Bacteroidetes-1]
MQLEDCFYFGKVIKTHGIKGEISIRIDADEPAAYKQLEFILLEINKKLIPFFIQSLKLNGNKAYVKLQDIETVEKAAEMATLDIYLPIEFLPKLTGNKFYFHEVPGYKVVDEISGLIGKIEKVLEYPSQSIFQIFKNEKEILIPIQDEVIIKVDRRSKTIYIKAPDGLIDLYLNS